MLQVNTDLNRQENSDTLEAMRRQLAQRENDLRTLQSQYQALLDKFLAERQRAKMLRDLSDRFGVR